MSEAISSRKRTLQYTFTVRDGICSHENYGIFIIPPFYSIGVLLASIAGLPDRVVDRAKNVSNQVYYFA